MYLCAMKTTTPSLSTAIRAFISPMGTCHNEKGYLSPIGTCHHKEKGVYPPR